MPFNSTASRVIDPKFQVAHNNLLIESLAHVASPRCMGAGAWARPKVDFPVWTSSDRMPCAYVLSCGEIGHTLSAYVERPVSAGKDAALHMARFGCLLLGNV